MASAWQIHHYRGGVLLPLLAVLIITLGACQPTKHSTGTLGPPWKGAAPRSGADNPDGDAAIPAAGFKPDMTKTLSFDDCVIIAAQQSPEMVNSVIDLEIADIGADSAMWKQVPEIHAQFHVITNLTKNDGDTYKGYGDTAYRLGFSVHDFQPVGNYFSYKAAKLMRDIAVFTHQKALDKMTERIGILLLRLESLGRMREHQAQLHSLAKSAVAYWRAQEGGGADKLAMEKARYREHQAAAALEKTDAQMVSLRLALKALLGVDAEVQLKLPDNPGVFMDQQDIRNAVSGDNAWEAAWRSSPETKALLTARRLHEYNIRLAWSRYLPNIGLDVFKANPNNAYAGNSSDDDTFVVLRFSFPLWDWGDRYRAVKESRLGKTKASQTLHRHRIDFSHQWALVLQDIRLARADFALAEHGVKLAVMEEQKAALEHSAGHGDFSALVAAKERHMDEALRREEALLQLKLKELSRGVVHGVFQRRFFEPYKGAEDVTP